MPKRHKEKLSSVTMEMEGILSSLANEDALKIFQAAKDGITSSTQIIKDFGLTQKRYYTRLRELIKVGLLEKNESEYQHTLLGKMLFETLVKRLEQVLTNRDRLDLIDKLQRSPSISFKEREQIAATISKDEILGFTDLFGVKPVKVAKTYEELVEAVSSLIEKAEEEIFFASRYTDVRVSEPILGAFRRGVKFSFLDGDKSNLSNRMQILRLILTNPTMVKNLFEFMNSGISVKYVDLPYSFIVVDKKYAGVELINPINEKFIFATFFESEVLSRKLIQMFKTLNESAGKSALAEFFRKKNKEN